MTAAAKSEHVHRWSDWSLHSSHRKPMWAKWFRGCMDCSVTQQSAVITPNGDDS